VISRPTTEQLARDCAREILESVLPNVQDEAVGVAVRMIEQVLRNIAVRSAHEIAWMASEIADMDQYARDVMDSVPARADELRPAFELLRDAPSSSLHLDDVVETYCRAGELFSIALEVAVSEDRKTLVARAAQLLDARSEHEIDAMADWSPIGR
jgi:hypothetical protein